MRTKSENGNLGYRVDSSGHNILVQQSLMADPVTERELKAEVPAADDDDLDVMDEEIDHNI